MTPDALRNRARMFLSALPLARTDDEDGDAEDDERFIRDLTALLLAIRNEALEEAAKECHIAWEGPKVKPGTKMALAVGMSLICDVCGLPTVPFGGEDICLDPTHEEGYSRDDDDREDDGVSDDDR